jgi:hypothetical protein
MYIISLLDIKEGCLLSILIDTNQNTADDDLQQAEKLWSKIGTGYRPLFLPP